MVVMRQDFFPLGLFYINVNETSNLSAAKNALAIS